MLLPNLVQVTESIPGSAVPLAMFNRRAWVPSTSLQWINDVPLITKKRIMPLIGEDPDTGDLTHLVKVAALQIRGREVLSIMGWLIDSFRGPRIFSWPSFPPDSNFYVDDLFSKAIGSIHEEQLSKIESNSNLGLGDSAWIIDLDCRVDWFFIELKLKQHKGEILNRGNLAFLGHRAIADFYIWGRDSGTLIDPQQSD